MPPNVALLCGTCWGPRVLECLVQIAPEARLAVVSFPDEPVGPRLLDAIRRATLAHGAEFVEARKVGREPRLVRSENPFDLANRRK